MVNRSFTKKALCVGAAIGAVLFEVAVFLGCEFALLTYSNTHMGSLGNLAFFAVLFVIPMLGSVIVSSTPLVVYRGTKKYLDAAYRRREWMLEHFGKDAVVSARETLLKAIMLVICFCAALVTAFVVTYVCATFRIIAGTVIVATAVIVVGLFVYGTWRVFNYYKVKHSKAVRKSIRRRYREM